MNRLPSPVMLVLITGMGAGADEPKRKEVDSGPVLAALRADIAAKPSRVLIAVEDALTMNEQAACEIVKTAIESTRADAKLTGEIVFTALERAPAMAATIVECAVSTSPHAVEQIKAAIRRALGDAAADGSAELAEGSGKAPPEEGSGKQPAASGKEPRGRAASQPAPDASDYYSFGESHVGVGGIYLTFPSAFVPGICDPGNPCCNGELTTACLRP